jgi:hypothetical protein
LDPYKVHPSNPDFTGIPFHGQGFPLIGRNFLSLAGFNYKSGSQKVGAICGTSITIHKFDQDQNQKDHLILEFLIN